MTPSGGSCRTNTFIKRKPKSPARGAVLLALLGVLATACCLRAEVRSSGDAPSELLKRSGESSDDTGSRMGGDAVSVEADNEELFASLGVESGDAFATLASIPVASNAVVRGIVVTVPNFPEIAANPGRPTISTPATLTPPGYVQMESGLLYAADSAEFSRRASYEEVMKMTVNPRVEMILSSEPMAYTSEALQGKLQTGDLTGGVQGVLLRGQGIEPTVSLSYLRLVRAGTASNLDIGGFRQGLVMLASSDAGKFHADINGMFNEQVGGHVRRAQYGQTVAVSHPLTPRIGVAGELWHFSQPLTRGNAVGNLWALNYNASPRLVLDASIAHGLTGSSTRWQAATGFTYVLPRGVRGRR